MDVVVGNTLRIRCAFPALSRTDHSEAVRMYFKLRLVLTNWPSPLTLQEAARIAQGLLLTSSPIAKSQKKPGGLRPIIAIAMAHPNSTFQHATPLLAVARVPPLLRGMLRCFVTGMMLALNKEDRGLLVVLDKYYEQLKFTATECIEVKRAHVARPIQVWWQYLTARRARRLARYGLFGLRGDARGRCRSRRERIAKPATPEAVHHWTSPSARDLKPLGRSVAGSLAGRRNARRNKTRALLWRISALSSDDGPPGTGAGTDASIGPISSRWMRTS